MLILNLSLEPGFFDVNVSPDKRTVFIQDETGLVDWLKDNMRELFEPFRQSDHIFSQKSIGVASSSGGEGNSQNYFQDSILSNFTYSSSTVEEEEETILDPEIHTDPLVQVVDVTPLEPEKEDCVATPKTHQSTLDLTTLFKFDASSKRKEPTITRCCSVSATPQGRDKSSVPSSSAASSFPDNRKKARLSLGTIKPSTRTRASVFSLIKGDLTVKCDLSSMSSSPSDRRELSEADASMHFEAGLAKDQSDLAEQELTRFIHKEDFKKMDVLGQFNLGFIIVRLGKDLFVIDQHAR